MDNPAPKSRKPLHKHVLHHAKRFGGHFTKYLYERDTIFALAWVFILILLVPLIPLHLHFFDPIEKAMEDFDYDDIAYSKLGKGKDNLLENRIVIINIGHLDRQGIAALIEKTASMSPKVMGLDAYFEGPRDSVKDAVLKEAFERTTNLVAASRIDWEENHGKGAFKEDFFQESYHQTGFVNVIGEEEGTLRLFSPYEKVNDSVHYNFDAMLVKNYNQQAYEKLVRRKDHYEVINYSRKTNQYRLLEPDDLFNNTVDESYIKGKIALLGYVDTSQDDIEDKKFTPMNNRIANKSVPDMNGIVVHANILSMILDDKYVTKMPLWAAIVLAVIIGWLHMSFFIRYYLENHLWFHLVAKIAQLVSAFLFMYLGIHLFDRYRIKLNMTLTILIIVLSVDIIYFYQGFAVWMHKKFKYRTVFHQSHH